MSERDLDEYHRMRDFERTSEPSGGTPSASGASFVIQKHAATRLHYDVRIEVDGVMPSWAVPKGPSYDPRVKRLAVHVEDHPLDYQTFEGVIPKGEYGGGSVIVWDRGTYRNITEKDGRPIDIRTAIGLGHVSVEFEGEKLRGGWSLTRTSTDGSGKESWIMVKRKDDYADGSLDITALQPNSVVTGRSVDDVGSRQDAQEPAHEQALWMPPMLAESSTVEKIQQAGVEWVFERKLDGLRCVAVRNGDDVQLWSRNHLSFNARFSGIVDALRALPVDNFTIDGEIVAYDNEGRTNFSLLQRGAATTAPTYAVFDVLHLLGRDTKDLPILDRKALVAKVVEPSSMLQLVATQTGDPAVLLERGCRNEWEGIIAKLPVSAYRSGRSSNWRKLKCSAAQELVIGGWTEPRGTRSGFGALLVGYFDEPGHALRFAGKVGTGFNHRLLASLHKQLLQLETSKSPFVDVVKEKTAHWCQPVMVANIAFTEWTADGKLRHPRFEGMRTDRDASDVTREKR